MPSPPQQPGTRLLLPAATPDWITVELVEHTLRVWQPYYRDPLSVEDAIGIIRRTASLLRTLSRQKA